ncbi:MAG: hypothetical protein PHO56_03855 [Patescibacteria group bacterium]|nr:hypothetical protein [Patescibacteria group bacterium]
MRTPTIQKVNKVVSKIFKGMLFFSAIAVGVIIIFAIIKLLFIVSVFNFFVLRFQSIFGMDIMAARFFSVIATSAIIIITPWIILFLTFGKKKKELLFVGLFAFAVLVPGVYLGTANTFFDRTTGKPAKYYVKTLEGFKFSSSENFDPKFGVKFKPITAQIIKEYYLWEKTGKMQGGLVVVPGKYFDAITGEPIAWYAKRADGEIQLFSLPGYDPVTGDLLKPITKEVAEMIIPQNDTVIETRAKENDHFWSDNMGLIIFYGLCFVAGSFFIMINHAYRGKT